MDSHAKIFNVRRATSAEAGACASRLAKLLLQKPDVLLLDEPTNHLDIESIQWLEDFLINNGKAVIVISHDRKFVDNITTRTIEVTMGRIYDYKVNYSQYLQLRKERREQQQKAYDEQRSSSPRRKPSSNGQGGRILKTLAGAEPCQDAGKAGIAGSRRGRHFGTAAEIPAFAPFGQLPRHDERREDVRRPCRIPQRQPDD